jgi:hypothetical protein
MTKGSLLFDKIVVHPRVHKKHPEIDDEDAISAWRDAISVVNRTYEPPDYYAAAGTDGKGRMLELVGVELEDGTLMIYHAIKLTEKMRSELGL